MDRRYKGAIHTAANAAAYHLGFQQFSYSEDSQRWVRATAGLVASQLVKTLQDKLYCSSAAGLQATTVNSTTADRDVFGAFKKAVSEHHQATFEEYERWKNTVLQGSERPPASGRDVSVQLLELAVHGLIWTEAANLRHVPGLLCFLYYVARHSAQFMAAQQELTSTDATPLGYRPLRLSDALPQLQPGLTTSSTAGSSGQAPRQDAVVEALALGSSNLPNSAFGWDLTVALTNLVNNLYKACPHLFEHPTAAAAAAAGAGRVPTATALQQVQDQMQALQQQGGPAAGRLAAIQPLLGQQPEVVQQAVIPLLELLLGLLSNVGDAGVTGSPQTAADPSAASSSKATPQVARDAGIHNPAVRAALMGLLELQKLLSRPTDHMDALAAGSAVYYAAELALSAMASETGQPLVKLCMRRLVCSVGNSAAPLRLQLLQQWHQEAAAAAAAPAGGAQTPRPTLEQMLALAVVGGRGQDSYLQLIVQPVFFFLAEQIDLMGSAEEEPALRIAYCDCNEAIWDPRKVAALLQQLRGSDYGTRRLGQGAVDQQLWQRLMAVGLQTGQVELRYPRDPNRLVLLRGLKEAANATANQQDTQGRLVGCHAALRFECTTLQETYAIAETGAAWWAHHAFNSKTFVEARSLMQPLLAFYRVYSLHLVLLVMMTAAAFVWEYSKSVSPTPSAGDLGQWLMAALALGPVADALLCALYYFGRLLLLCYHIRVKRVQKATGDANDRNIRIQPFPKTEGREFMVNFTLLVFWCGWFGLMLLFVLWPTLTSLNATPAILTNLAAKLKIKGTSVLVLVLPILHAALFWVGLGLLLQRPGYQASAWNWLKTCVPGMQQLTGGLAPHLLLYPVKSLELDKRRWLVNAGLWMITLAAKVAFDFLVVLRPYAREVLLVLNKEQDFLQEIIRCPDDFHAGKLALTSGILTSLALCLPILLLSFSDTGLIFSVVSGGFSVLQGFRRGVGSVRTWDDLVRGAENLLYQHLKHCISPQAWQLHVDVLRRPEYELMYVSFCKSWNAGINSFYNQDLINATTRDRLTLQQLQTSSISVNQLETMRDLELPPVLLADCFVAGFAEEAVQGGQYSRHHRWVVHIQWRWVLMVLVNSGLLDRKSAVQLQHLRLTLGTHNDQQHKRWASAAAKVLQLLQLLAGPQQPLLLQQPAAQQQRWPTVVKLMAELTKMLDDEVVYSAAHPDGAGCFSLVDTPSTVNSSILRGITQQLAADWAQQQQELAVAESAPASRAATPAGGRPIAVSHSDIEMVVRTDSAADSSSFSTGGSHLAEKQRAVDLLLQTWAEISQEDVKLLQQVVGWLSANWSRTQGDTRPPDEEALRHLTAFASTLNDPGLATPPAVHEMPSLTTLAPLYAEDVMYALNESSVLSTLKAKLGLSDADLEDPQKISKINRAGVVYLLTDEGAPTLALSYLKSVHDRYDCRQWPNFMERMRVKLEAERRRARAEAEQHGEAYEEVPIPSPLTEYHFLKGQPLEPFQEELLLWASNRGQLVSRTARGMMAYRDALRVQAELENPQLQWVDPPGAGTTAQQAAFRQRAQDVLRELLIEDLVDAKYSALISAQLYQAQAANKGSLKDQWNIHGLQRLRQLHSRLKLAYIAFDQLAAGSRQGSHVQLKREASVVMRSVREQELAQNAGSDAGLEAYRVRLPINFESARGVIIGEGKPENQNHALIFCTGSMLQTMDINQDNTLLESLKLRNLLSEFSDVKVALVGVPEWVFSQDSGALAGFSAAPEKAFGTTLQRFMDYPGGVRFHYGHPDVWRKTFIVNCGGLSKANRGLHVSEDVFGGYNVTLRGHKIKFVDYISVGKGRDMGFESINTFEAKVASGNGEQMISREARRLGQHFDFFRLLTWYHTGIGFFINTTLVMASVLVVALVQLMVNLLELDLGALGAGVMGLQLVQLGSLAVVVHFLTQVLQQGVLAALVGLLKQFVQGGPMFFIFRAQTTATGFMRDLLYGGASYAATGRGYKLTTTTFTTMYERYGRSHMGYGAAVGIAALAAITVNTQGMSGIATLWGPLTVAVSMLFGPWWFNPLSLRTSVVLEDASQHQNWMASSSPQSSWAVFNKKYWARPRDSSQVQQCRLGRALGLHLVQLPPTIVLLAVTTSRIMTDNNCAMGGGRSKLQKIIWFLILTGMWCVPLFIVLQLKAIRPKWGMPTWPRILSQVTLFVLLGSLVVSGYVSNQDWSGWSNSYYTFLGILLLLTLVPLLNTWPWRFAWAPVDGLSWVVDSALFGAITVLRLVVSFGDIATSLQQQLLFNSEYGQQSLEDEAIAGTEAHKRVRRLLKQEQKMKDM